MNSVHNAPKALGGTYVPTTLGAALFQAANKVKQGSNTQLARQVRAAVSQNERRYLVSLDKKRSI